MLHAVPIQYFLMFVVSNGICLSGTSLRIVNIDRHGGGGGGGVADVDRLRVASVFTYYFICHDD